MARFEFTNLWRGGDANAVVTRGELPYSPLLCIVLKHIHITDNNLNPTYYKRQKATNVAPFETLRESESYKQQIPLETKKLICVGPNN